LAGGALEVRRGQTKENRVLIVELELRAFNGGPGMQALDTAEVAGARCEVQVVSRPGPGSQVRFR
jgi:hypothetical protein